jgi:hypothetical protein
MKANIATMADRLEYACFLRICNSSIAVTLWINLGEQHKVLDVL